MQQARHLAYFANPQISSKFRVPYSYSLKKPIYVFFDQLWYVCILYSGTVHSNFGVIEIELQVLATGDRYALAHVLNVPPYSPSRGMMELLVDCGLNLG
jgi:hypothetical protein